MKVKTILGGLVFCFPLALASQAAQMSTTLDWEFNDAANPALPTSELTINPSGAAASINIPTVIFDPAYILGSKPTKAEYGNARTGLWDSSDGTFTLNFNAISSTPGGSLNATITVDQFISADHFTYSGVDSIAGWTKSGTSEILETTDRNGQWVRNTYTWSGTAGTPITATFANQDFSFLIDRVVYASSGDLVAVPEPIYYQSIAGAFLVVGALWTRNRRKQA